MAPNIQFEQRHDAPGSPSGPYLHGSAGLLNVPGTDLRIISALQLPITGALAEIPVITPGMPNPAGNGLDGNEMAYYSNILTGITEGNADEFENQPTTDCAPGPEGGLKKLCTYVNTYARYRFSTREVSMWRASQRADFADQGMTVINNPAVNANSPWLSTMMPSLSAALSGEIQDRLLEMMVSALRMVHQRVWVGSPANNSGERRDMMGMDLHINVNTHVDKDTSSICTAANSDVKNFGYSLVTGTVRDIVRYIEMCDRFVSFKALQQGLTPYVYDMYMTPTLWEELSQMWPVRQYQAFTAQLAATGVTGNMDIRDAYELRNSFRSGMMLPVNGKAVRVVLDEGIVEQNVTTTGNLIAGRYASTIYGVPRTVMGRIPATFFQFFNWANPQAEAIAKLVGGQMGGGPTFTSDGGFIRWYTEFTRGCFRLMNDMSPRLHMITPQLAWRIDNVAYEPLQHLASADPDSSYFVDGGRATGQIPTFYAPWSTTTKVGI